MKVGTRDIATRAWFNLDLLWVIALVLSGFLILLL
jgi:hypothetical protein